MHILLGLTIGVALLYFWLIGHWFARVLVFLMLAGALGLGVAALFSLGNTYNPVGNVFGCLLGITVAWFIAGIPTYYRRHQSRDLDRRVNHVMAVLGAGMPPRLPEGH